MNKKNLPVEFNYNSQNVRTLTIKNQPYFVAKDVCDILEYSDVSMTLQKLDDDEKLIQKFFVSGQEREMWTINQSGLYALILRSNKPEAKKFRKWITSDVIPNLMKNGTYSMPRGRRALPENFDRRIMTAYCFTVRVEVYESGKREYWRANLNNSVNYKTNINDLIITKQILENEINNLNY